MLTRRAFLLFSSAAALMLGLHPASAQAPDTAAASAFVDQAGQQLVRVVNSGVPETQKKAELQEVVDRIVDVNDVGRFCLGRYWRTATPQQQQNYLQVFHSVLMFNITSKIGDYNGVNFALGRAAPRDNDVLVSTTVTRPNNAPANVQWIVSSATGSPKIVDVLAEGTSLRQTQRADYASYLARNNGNIDALIRAMQQQVGQGG